MAPDGSYVLWLVPKCASTTMQRVFRESHRVTPISQIPVKCKRIAIVRQPLRRLVSTYLDKILGQRNSGSISINRSDGDKAIPGIEPGMDFDSFCEVVLEHPKSNRHWIAQADWIASDGREADYLVAFEQLPAAWDSLAFLGVPAWPAERHGVTGFKGNPDSLYSADLKRRLTELYARDLELCKSALLPLENER